MRGSGPMAHRVQSCIHISKKRPAAVRGSFAQTHIIDRFTERLKHSLTRGKLDDGKHIKLGDGRHNNDGRHSSDGRHNDGRHNDGRHNSDGRHKDGRHNDGRHNDGRRNDKKIIKRSRRRVCGSTRCCCKEIPY